MVQLCFIKKYCQRRYKYLVPRRDKYDFLKKKKNTQILPNISLKLIIKILEFLIDNIFVMFGGRVFQQTVEIYLWVQPVPLFSLTCSFIRMRQTSYRGFSRKTKKKLARSFNFTFRYIDDIFSLNNSRLLILLITCIPLSLK